MHVFADNTTACGLYSKNLTNSGDVVECAYRGNTTIPILPGRLRCYNLVSMPTID